jgi:ABC-type lipoprotein release transport system permease subunit
MLLSLFKWLTVSAVVFLHPYYISMTDINYNNKSKSLEVSIRIFTDDFEKVMRKNCNCKVDLLKPENKKAMGILINQYIQEHLQLKVNGQTKTLEFAGYQQEEESTWNYYQVKDIPQVKKIEINNSLLHDYREEQINMLHININGKEQSDKLNYPDKLFSMSF